MHAARNRPRTRVIAAVVAVSLAVAGAFIAFALGSGDACDSYAPDAAALARSAADARSEAATMVECRAVVGRTESEISELIGVAPEDQRDVGSVGDRYRIWSFAGDAGLEVNFADDGRASLARVLPVDGAD